MLLTLLVFFMPIILNYKIFYIIKAALQNKVIQQESVKTNEDILLECPETTVKSYLIFLPP
jgi:hypothetical protein